MVVYVSVLVFGPFMNIWTVIVLSTAGSSTPIQFIIFFYITLCIFCDSFVCW